MNVAELIDRLSELPAETAVFLIEDPKPGRVASLPPEARSARQVVKSGDGFVVIAGA